MPRAAPSCPADATTRSPTGSPITYPLSNGTYYNPRSAKCLYDPGGTTNTTQLEINNCNAASRTELGTCHTRSLP